MTHSSGSRRRQPHAILSPGSWTGLPLKIGWASFAIICGWLAGVTGVLRRVRFRKPFVSMRWRAWDSARDGWRFLERSAALCRRAWEGTYARDADAGGVNATRTQKRFALFCTWPRAAHLRYFAYNQSIVSAIRTPVSVKTIPVRRLTVIRVLRSRPRSTFACSDVIPNPIMLPSFGQVTPLARAIAVYWWSRSL